MAFVHPALDEALLRPLSLTTRLEALADPIVTVGLSNGRTSRQVEDFAAKQSTRLVLGLGLKTATR